MKRIFVFAILCVLGICVFAQNYPIIQIEGQKYYEYTVQKSEGLYGISKKFNVLQSDIYGANPELQNSNEIKVGQILLIPISEPKTKSAETDLRSQYIDHKITPKQTLYSISKMYGVSQTDICKANSIDESYNIKVGEILRIPISSKQSNTPQNAVLHKVMLDNQPPPKASAENTVSKENREYITYEVKKRGESLYSISRRFNVDINEILSANPYAENGVKKGDVLQIPIAGKQVPKQIEKLQGDVRHIVKPKETIYGISRQYNISQEELIKANPSIENSLKIGDTLSIPQKLLNNSKQSNSSRSTDYTTSVNLTSNGKNRFKVVYLLPFTNGDPNRQRSTDNFVEFYRGALLAMEEIKKKGMSLDVFTFDTRFGAANIQEILSSDTLKNADIIIGPAYPEQIGRVAEFAKKNRIFHVVPFSSNVSKGDMFDMLYQNNPTVAEISKSVSKKILDKYKNPNIFFVNFGNDKGEQHYKFSDYFKRELKSKSIRFADLNAQSTYDLNKLYSLPKNRSNLIVVSTTDYDEYMNFVSSNTIHNAVFVGDEYLIDAARSTGNEFVAYSLFNSKPNEEYLQNYNLFFKSRHTKSIPEYDLLGYDLTLYFCSALGANKTLNFDTKVSQMQSSFNFVKRTGAFVNNGFFLFYLKNSDLTVEQH